MIDAFNKEFLDAIQAPELRAGEAAIHRAALAMAREAGAEAFCKKLLAHPVLFDRAEFDELGAAARALLRAQAKILGHLLATRSAEDVLAMFGMPRRLLPFMRWDNLARLDETVSRLDLIPTATGYAFCELNVIPAVGGGEARRWLEDYFPALGFPDVGHMPDPLRELAALYRGVVQRHGLSRIAILDSTVHGKLGYPRQELLRRFLVEECPGVTVELHDEDTYPAAWLTRAEGERTLVHRMFTYEEVDDDYAFLDRLWQSGARMAGFESDLRMSKRFLVLLCDPAYHGLLAEDERAAIARFLPAATALSAETLRAALRDRRELVFKLDAPASYGGTGVLIGAECEAAALEERLRAEGVDRWICQRAVDATSLPLRAAQDAEALDYRLVLGLYVYGDTPAGLVVRGSRSTRVVNASSATGRIGWGFVVSEDARRALVRHAQLRGQSPATRAAHDSTPPAKLVEFMLSGWAAPPSETIAPHPHAALIRDRRARLSRLYPGEVLVVPSGTLKVRSNDEYYPFRATSDFVYLTGHQEPDSALVMVPDGEGHRAVLFVDPRLGKTDLSFFTDRIKGELWEGPVLGVDGARARYRIADTRPLSALRELIDQVVRPADKLRVLRGHASELERWIDRGDDPQRARDQAFAIALSELRLIKDEGEIAELRDAIAATRRGFEDVIAGLRGARSERELEAAFVGRARIEGNGTGYLPVVAAGAHACTLHWRRNDGPVRRGELLLLDAGVENCALYTADITRVLPVDGRFTAPQREIYELVLAAQRAALAQVRPGVDFMEPNRAAMAVLAHGLVALGILPMSAEQALRDDQQFYRRYSLHNISHMLGLDVHDCAKARAEVYRYGPLAAGMVLTIEPGLYFQLDDLTVPERYRGIGVRIEDDVLVTPAGHDNLSAHIPTDPDEVERWIADVWAGRRSPPP